MMMAPMRVGQMEDRRVAVEDKYWRPLLVLRIMTSSFQALTSQPGELTPKHGEGFRRCHVIQALSRDVLIASLRHPDVIASRPSEIRYHVVSDSNSDNCWKKKKNSGFH
jgi:hypothetical protein